MKIIGHLSDGQLLVQINRADFQAITGTPYYDDLVTKAFDPKTSASVEINLTLVAENMQKVKHVPAELRKLHKAATEALNSINNALEACKVLPILSTKTVQE